MTTIEHAVLITLSDPLAAATPPERLRLFKRGANETMKGTFVFDDEAAKTVLDAYEKHGAELPFDYDHAMVNGSAPSERVAAGWFKLSVEDGELWATDIRWTPKAASAIEAREWRYLSPAFLNDRKTGRITKILNVALTNLPATVGMEPIAAHADTVVPPNEGQAIMSDTDQLVALTGVADPGEARATILAWRAKAERTDALEAQLTELNQKAARLEFDGLVKSARADGRLAPAKVAEVEAIFASHGIDVARASLSLLSAPSKTKVEPPTGGVDSIDLDDTDREIMKRYGFTEAQMRAGKVTLSQSDAAHAAGKVG